MLSMAPYLAALSLMLGLACASNVVLVDTRDARHLLSGSQQPHRVHQSHLASVAAAVTGLLPAEVVDADLSSVLERIVKPRAFQKPRAYAVINAPGLTAEDLGSVFQGKGHVQLDVQGGSCLISATTQALADAVSANPDAHLYLLDQHGLQGCDNACLQQHLQGVASTCKLQVAAGPEPLTGELTLPNGAKLDLSQAEDRMLAVELASVLAGVKARSAEVAQRTELKVAQEDVELYELNVMALRGIARKYGADSEQAAGARVALAELVAFAVQSLDTAYGDDVVYQVTVASKSAGSDSVKALTSWKDSSRRQLLQAAWAKPDETAAAKSFSAKAAGYGSFILLLYFSLAAMHCMCNMPFKVDTLLFPGAKKDQ